MGKKRDPFLEAMLAALDGRISPQELGEHTAAEIERLAPDWERIARDAGERKELRPPAKAVEPPTAPADAPAPAAPAEPAPADPLAERRAARKDLARLKKKTPEARIAAIRNARSGYRRPALIDLLLAQARASFAKQATEAPAWVDCALEVAKILPFPRPDDYPRLRVRLLAHKANALRVIGDLVAADELWEEIHAESKTFPPADLRGQAELLSLEASLRRAQRRFESARLLLEGAEFSYRSCDDRTGTIKTLLKRASVAEYAGDSEAAVTDCRAAGALVERDQDPRSAWTAAANEANALVSSGRPTEAEALLAAALPWFERCGDSCLNVRKTWVEGKIAWAQGRFPEADERLRIVARDCAAQGLAYDAALATLDRAGLALQRGELAKVKRLAAALEPVFRSRKVHREAAAALRLFQEAARVETVTLPFLAALRRYLDLAQHDPMYAFTPPASHVTR